MFSPEGGAMSDRYLKVVLTLIAVELGWIALTHGAQPVSAQAQLASTPTPVIITGVQLRDGRTYLPVGVMGGSVGNPPGGLQQLAVRVDTSQQALRVDVPIPLDVRIVAPVRIEPGEKPIKMEAMPYTPAQRPGE
jgi:hypothetical protein